MSLPFFYVEDLDVRKDIVVLEEDTSKHITQVLRMKKEEELLLTNGKGARAKAIIVNDHRKKCEVKIAAIETIPLPSSEVIIGISLIKNATRFEWFLEKATEVGVTGIIPLICDRTEKEKFRYDRMKNILVSAMLQSQQCWLPHLYEPTEYEKVIQQYQSYQKFIAHCLPHAKQTLQKGNNHTIVLIGPEGDFTPMEIESAIQNNFLPVTLGNNRLRTETAGIVAATLLCCQ